MASATRAFLDSLRVAMSLADGGSGGGGRSRIAASAGFAPGTEPSDFRRISALVELAQNGDSEAFGQLYERYVDTVYRYVYVRVGNVHLAQDLTSETFLRALRRLDSFSWQGRDIVAWFITIARNLITDNDAIAVQVSGSQHDRGMTELSRAQEHICDARDLLGLDPVSGQHVAEALGVCPARLPRAAPAPRSGRDQHSPAARHLWCPCGPGSLGQSAPGASSGGPSASLPAGGAQAVSSTSGALQDVSGSVGDGGASVGVGGGGVSPGSGGASAGLPLGSSSSVSLTVPLSPLSSATTLLPSVPLALGATP